MPLRLLVPEQQIATIANRMCFCVDLGQIATPTRFWNPLGAAGDSLEVIGRPTFDFARPRLRGLAQALANECGPLSFADTPLLRSHR